MNITLDYKELGKWDRRFYDMAHFVKSFSKDRTKVGAVLVRGFGKVHFAIGYNGPPPGLDDEYIYSLENKNDYIIHAEDNAIRNAIFNPHGGSIYATRPLCLGCALTVISHRIANVFMPPGGNVGQKWATSCQEAERLLDERANLVQVTNEPDCWRIPREFEDRTEETRANARPTNFLWATPEGS